MKTKPQFNYDRALSWSGLSCFDNPDYPEYSDPEKWYQRYMLGIQDKPSKEMLFGGMIDKKIQNDPTFLPELERYPEMQLIMKPMYKDIPLVGYADQWDPKPKNLRLADDKTGKTPWTQARADKTGQLTMYATMLYLMNKTKPEDIEFAIRWMPTTQHADLSIGFAKPFKLQTFKTKRTMADILKFMAYIERTQKAMIKYTEDHE